MPYDIDGLPIGQKEMDEAKRREDEYIIDHANHLLRLSRRVADLADQERPHDILDLTDEIEDTWETIFRACRDYGRGDENGI